MAGFVEKIKTTLGENRRRRIIAGAWQPFVDGAIAKTINLPRDYPFERYREIFEAAYRLGLKGCTVFRPNPSMQGVLSNASAAGVEVAAKECCLST